MMNRSPDAVWRFDFEIGADITVVGECANGEEAIESITSLKPDLVFLDVQMPGIGGLDVLRALPPRSVPCIIFLTAFDEYALAAFEVQALDLSSEAHR